MCKTLEDMHVSGAPPTDGGKVARTWVSELVPDAGRFYVSLLSRSLVALFLVQGCMVLLKNCETYYYYTTVMLRSLASNV